MTFTNPPVVRLTNIFHEPYNNAVATARTCYASKIIDVEQVTGVGLLPEQQAQRQEQRDRIAVSTYQAGHHTTLQHTHVQFALTGVSRHVLWSFFHATPFYNSEQQSQRYVHMKPDSVLIPDLGDPQAQQIYTEAVADQMTMYEHLTEALMPVAAEHYYQIFPARRRHDKYRKEIQKKAQEVARYVLPIGTVANLYHTVSLLTLLRYHHMANQHDAPQETRWIVDQMVAAVKAADPLLEKVLETPLELEDMPETVWVKAENSVAQAFRQRFDLSLAGRVSQVIDYKVNQEAVMAESIREVLGLMPEQLADQAALELVLNPAQNNILHTTLNNTTHSKLNRVMHHVSYTFRKKLSHTADSQDQRHRMVPGSRPVLGLHLTDTPDFITPRLLPHAEASLKEYDACMERTWERINQLRAMNVPLEFVSYLLPNAVAVRFTESGDLLNLHHKLKARLCYNAQEEIWQASLDELEQITAINPIIGKFLLPPCGLRKLGGRKPFCPEGDRYCGVPVWTLQPKDYLRVL